MSGTPSTLDWHFPNTRNEDSTAHFSPPVTPIFGVSMREEQTASAYIRISQNITDHQPGTEFEVRDSSRTYSYSLRCITPQEAGTQQVAGKRWRATAKNGFFVTKEDPYRLLSLSDWNPDKHDLKLCHFFECTDMREVSHSVLETVLRQVRSGVVGATLITTAVGDSPKLLAENPQSYVARPGTATIRDIMRQILHREDDAFLQAFARANKVEPDTPLNIGTVVQFPHTNVQTPQTQEPLHQTPQKIKQNAPAEDISTYTVCRGDTLSKIAQRHHVPLGTLCSINRIKSHLIRPGQILNIPGKAEQQTPVKQTTHQQRPVHVQIPVHTSIPTSTSFSLDGLVEGSHIDTHLLRQVLQAMFSYKPARASEEYYGFLTAIGKSIGLVAEFSPDQAQSAPLGNSQNEQMYAILWVLQDYLHDHGIMLDLPMDKSSLIVPIVTREKLSHLQKTEALKIYGGKIGFKKSISPDRLTSYLDKQTRGENIFIMTWKIGKNMISSLVFRTQHGYQVIDMGLPGKKITSFANYVNYMNTQRAHLQTIVGTKLRWDKEHIPSEEKHLPDIITESHAQEKTVESQASEEPSVFGSLVKRIGNWWNEAEPEVKTATSPKRESKIEHTPEIRNHPLPPIDLISNGNYGFTEESATAFIARVGGHVDKVPAGMRYNNPFNIKYSEGSDFQQRICIGYSESPNKDQGDPQAAFIGPEHGMYSGIRLILHRFQKNGLDTVNSLIASSPLGWTQDRTPENKVGHNAAREIAKRMGVGVNDTLNFRDGDVFSSFIRELLVQEQGVSSKLYTDKMIRHCIDIANRDTNSPIWPGYFDGYPEPKNRPAVKVTTKSEPKVLKTIAIDTALPGISRDFRGFSKDDIANIVGTAILEPQGSLRGAQKGGLAPDTDRLLHIAEKIGIGQDVKDVVFGKWCGANARILYNSIVQHLNSRGVQMPHIWSADIGSGSGVGNYFDHTRERGGLPATARVINGIKSKPGKAELESLLLSSAGHIFIISYSHRGNGHVNMAFRVKTNGSDKLVIFDASWLTGATLTSGIRGIGGFHDFQKYIASFVNGEEVLDEQGKLGIGAAPNRYNVTSVLAISNTPLPIPVPVREETVASTITGMPIRITSLLTGGTVTPTAGKKTVTHKIDGTVVMKPYSIEARINFLRKYLAAHPEIHAKHIKLEKYNGDPATNIFILGLLVKNPDMYTAWQEEVMRPENIRAQHITSN